MTTDRDRVDAAWAAYDGSNHPDMRCDPFEEGAFYAGWRAAVDALTPQERTVQAMSPMEKERVSREALLADLRARRADALAPNDKLKQVYRDGKAALVPAAPPPVPEDVLNKLARAVQRLGASGTEEELEGVFWQILSASAPPADTGDGGAAGALERIAAAEFADPATDDLTVPLAIELSERDRRIRDLDAEVERLTRERDDEKEGVEIAVYERDEAREAAGDYASHLERAEHERDEAREKAAEQGRHAVDLFDEAYRLRGELAAAEKERDEARRDAECQRGNVDDNYAKLQAAEARLALARADALEEAALHCETAGLASGHDVACILADQIRALADTEPANTGGEDA